MKAEELMIGDWLFYKGQVAAFPFKVEQITKKKVGYHAEPNEHRMHYLRLSECKPIPLTAEMLSELGFKKKGNRYGIYDDYFDFEMHEYNDGIWVVSYHCCEMSLPDEQLLICYIHQLQHFMRHCGIEKTIEL